MIRLHGIIQGLNRGGNNMSNTRAAAKAAKAAIPRLYAIELETSQ